MANLMRRSKSVPFDPLLLYSAAFIPNLLLHRRKNEPRCALLASWSLASFSESLPQKENHGCPFVVESLLCCGRRGRRFIEKHASSPTVFKVAIVSRDRPPQKSVFSHSKMKCGPLGTRPSTDAGCAKKLVCRLPISQNPKNILF